MPNFNSMANICTYTELSNKHLKKMKRVQDTQYKFFATPLEFLKRFHFNKTLVVFFNKYTKNIMYMTIIVLY